MPRAPASVRDDFTARDRFVVLRSAPTWTLPSGRFLRIIPRGSSRDPGWWDRDSRDERADEGREGSLTPTTLVVDHPEGGEMERRLLPRYAPVRAQPGAQQRPDALRRPRPARPRRGRGRPSCA